MKDYILSYKSMILQGNLQENIEIIWTQLYISLILTIRECNACNDLYENKTHGIIQNDGSISWNMDFIRKYEVKSFENKRCLQCKQLPICMGVCPRDNEYVNACKFDGMDINLEDSMVNYIESMCK